ncbi:hypothetical protein COLO4_07046 [Corchorus olitorius]|uniref:Uncharacterized protein n=1 Tax=Corchorus olitorius TaxID=93759 RepID=A0A1R3KL53_9ROSI|nr:hypothetical protein COLO4_07046 [Corchorus olitorius]
MLRRFICRMIGLPFGMEVVDPDFGLPKELIVFLHVLSDGNLWKVKLEFLLSTLFVWNTTERIRVLENIYQLWKRRLIVLVQLDNLLKAKYTHQLDVVRYGCNALHHYNGKQYGWIKHSNGLRLYLTNAKIEGMLTVAILDLYVYLYESLLEYAKKYGGIIDPQQLAISKIDTSLKPLPGRDMKGEDVNMLRIFMCRMIGLPFGMEEVERQVGVSPLYPVSNGETLHFTKVEIEGTLSTAIPNLYVYHYESLLEYVKRHGSRSKELCDKSLAAEHF